MKQIVTLALLLLTFSAVEIKYPIRFAYINTIKSWWPATDIAAGMGVPGYAQ